MSRAKSDFAKLTKLQRQLKNINKKGMRAGAKLVVQAIKAAAPVDSGALRQSIASKVDAMKGETTAYAVAGPRSSYMRAAGGWLKRPAKYAHLVERGRFARPFLAPAWQANRQPFLARVEEVVGRELRGVIDG